MTKRKSAPDSPTLTVEEAAVLLGIGRCMAYDAARRGELPVLTIGRRILVIRHKLEELIGSTRGSAIAPGPCKTSQAPDPAISSAATVEIVAPELPVSCDEPVIARADDAGLLNADYILANATRFKRVSAIYFLCSQDEIIYVGQALDVYERISRHIFEGTKRFTRVFMIHCEPNDLNQVERNYIRKFRPRYNKAHNVIADAAAPSPSEGVAA